MNRPPPYFPQNTLNPPDPKRYTKFKLTIAAAAIFLLLLLAGAVYGLYYLFRWAFS